MRADRVTHSHSKEQSCILNLRRSGPLSAMCVDLWPSLSDPPQCSWSSCWNRGPWLRCHSWSDSEWTPPRLKLVIAQPRHDCGCQGFDATGPLAWRHIARPCRCSPLLGSTAPVDGGVQNIAASAQIPAMKWIPDVLSVGGSWKMGLLFGLLWSVDCCWSKYHFKQK